LSHYWGNQVESATEIGEKINNLSKQLNAVAGIALVAVSMSDEGRLLGDCLTCEELSGGLLTGE